MLEREESSDHTNLEAKSNLHFLEKLTWGELTIEESTWIVGWVTKRAFLSYNAVGYVQCF